MAKLLKIALDRQSYDLAAYILIYGLIRAKQSEKKRNQKGRQNGILQQGA